MEFLNWKLFKFNKKGGEQLPYLSTKL